MGANITSTAPGGGEDFLQPASPEQGLRELSLGGSLTANLRELTEHQAELGGAVAAAQAGCRDLYQVEADLAALRDEFKRYEANKAARYQKLKALLGKGGSIENLMPEIRAEFGDDQLGLLTMGMQDEDSDVRSDCTEALGLLGPQAEAVIPLLTRALEDPDNQVVVAAALSLRILDCSSYHATVIPALIGKLEETDLGVGIRACSALGRLGKPAMPALVAALGLPHPEGRENAAYALGHIGADAQCALPKLQELAMQDPCQQVREAALSSIRKIRGEK